MMITRHWSLLLVGLFGVFALASASTRESMKSVGPADLTSLAGTWQGTASSAQALSQPVTIMLGTDGAYTMTRARAPRAGHGQQAHADLEEHDRRADPRPDHDRRPTLS
jgi:hypothetical protein